MPADRFICRNCDYETSALYDDDPYQAAQEHADDEDHLLDVWTTMTSIIPKDVQQG